MPRNIGSSGENSTFVCIGLTYPNGNCEGQLVTDYWKPPGRIIGKCICDPPLFITTLAWTTFLVPEMTERVCTTWVSALHDRHGEYFDDFLSDEFGVDADATIVLLDVIAQLSDRLWDSRDVLPAWLELIRPCAVSFRDVNCRINNWFRPLVKLAKERGLQTGDAYPLLGDEEFALLCSPGTEEGLQSLDSRQDLQSLTVSYQHGMCGSASGRL